MDSPNPPIEFWYGNYKTHQPIQQWYFEPNSAVPVPKEGSDWRFKGKQYTVEKITHEWIPEDNPRKVGWLKLIIVHIEVMPTFTRRSIT